MSERVLCGLEPERVMYYFEEISRIPRESGNEKQISDYILKWALERKLDAVQDEFFNLIIKKPASEGYEKSAPVILQAHMDMVCEKTADSIHDFSKDPIKLKVEGDLISSAVGTSIGADDGIGVAYCMAVLEDEALKHPPVEVMLTTEEESTFNGAMSVYTGHFKGTRLINLDHAVENEVLAGSSGGSGVKVTMNITREDESLTKGYKCFTVRIGELPGGHSGEDIHRGHGNAISLMARMLYNCRKNVDFKLSEMYAGTSRLAICRDVNAILWVKEEEIDIFQQNVSRMEDIFQEEYGAITDSLKISLWERADYSKGGITEESFTKILHVLYLFPDGIQHMNNVVEGVVESSINLGIIRMYADSFEITGEIRSGFNSTGAHIKDKVRNLCELCEAQLEFFAGYPSWTYNPKSVLREKAQAAYREEFGGELKTVVLHAGIECGCLLEKMPYLDAIGMGPNCWGFHSPEERMSIKSVNSTWRLLKRLLENL